jgi:hypothetical protein
MMTIEEMRVELYERARVYVAEMQPSHAPEVIVKHAHDGVDAMINSRIAAGEDEKTALEYALGQDIKKLITVIIAQ